MISQLERRILDLLSSPTSVDKIRSALVEERVSFWAVNQAINSLKIKKLIVEIERGWFRRV